MNIMYKPSWTKSLDSVYKVWTAQNIYVGEITAISNDDAIRKAKAICPAPMVRSIELDRALTAAAKNWGH